MYYILISLLSIINIAANFSSVSFSEEGAALAATVVHNSPTPSI
jgi:hypothetical protein